MTHGTGSISIDLAVQRGVNGERIAILALVLVVGVGVGSGTQSALWGVLASAVLVATLAWPRSRHLLMSGLHRISGR